MFIKSLDNKTLKDWIQLRKKLWVNCSDDESRAEYKKYLKHKDEYYFILGYDEDIPMGFLKGRIRDYAEGCSTDKVGYLEGWYILEPYRNQKLGKLLFNHFKEWCKKNNLREIGSDALLDNISSHKAHKALGFVEIERSIRYLMKI